MSEAGFVIIDASLWVSRLVPQDAFHQVIKTWMAKQRAEGVILLSPSLLLAEVGGAISRRTGDVQLARQSIESLERLPGLRLVEMDHALVQDAADVAAEVGLRGADSFYVALAKRLKLPLASLDKDQIERTAGLVSINYIGGFHAT